MDKLFYSLRDTLKDRKAKCISTKCILVNDTTYNNIIKCEQYLYNPILLGYKIVIDNALDDDVVEII